MLAIASPLLADYVLVHGLTRDAGLMSYRGLVMAGALLDNISAPMSMRSFNFVQGLGASILLIQAYMETLEEDYGYTQIWIKFLLKFLVFLSIISIMNLRIDVYTDFKLMSELDIQNDKLGPIAKNKVEEIVDKKNVLVGPPYVLVTLNTWFDDVARTLIKTFDKTVLKDPDIERNIFILKKNSIIENTDFGVAINEYVHQCVGDVKNNHPTTFNINFQNQGGFDFASEDFMRRWYTTAQKFVFTATGDRIQEDPDTWKMTFFTYEQASLVFQKYIDRVENDAKLRLVTKSAPTSTQGVVTNSCASMLEGLYLFADEQGVQAKEQFLAAHRGEKVSKVDEFYSLLVKKIRLLDTKLDEVGLIASEKDIQNIKVRYLAKTINDTYVITTNSLASEGDSEVGATLKTMGRVSEKVAKTLLAGDPQLLRLIAAPIKSEIVNNGYVLFAMMAYIVLYISMIIPGMFFQKFGAFFILLFTAKMIPVTQALVLHYMRWVAQGNYRGFDFEGFSKDKDSYIYDIMGTSKYLNADQVDAFLMLYENAPIITAIVITVSASGMAALSRGITSTQGGGILGKMMPKLTGKKKE